MGLFGGSSSSSTAYETNTQSTFASTDNGDGSPVKLNAAQSHLTDVTINTTDGGAVNDAMEFASGTTGNAMNFATMAVKEALNGVSISVGNSLDLVRETLNSVAERAMVTDQQQAIQMGRNQSLVSDAMKNDDERSFNELAKWAVVGGLGVAAIWVFGGK
jgi:hypothetical protein